MVSSESRVLQHKPRTPLQVATTLRLFIPLLVIFGFHLGFETGRHQIGVFDICGVGFALVVIIISVYVSISQLLRGPEKG